MTDTVPRAEQEAVDEALVALGFYAERTIHSLHRVGTHRALSTEEERARTAAFIVVRTLHDPSYEPLFDRDEPATPPT